MREWWEDIQWQPIRVQKEIQRARRRFWVGLVAFLIVFGSGAVAGVESERRANKAHSEHMQKMDEVSAKAQELAVRRYGP